MRIKQLDMSSSLSHQVHHRKEFSNNADFDIGSILSFNFDLFNLDLDLKPIAEGFDCTLLCPRIVLNLERFSLSEDNSSVDIWNSPNKKYRNSFTFYFDPIDLVCHANRIPYLFSYNSTGVMSLMVF